MRISIFAVLACAFSCAAPENEVATEAAAREQVAAAMQRYMVHARAVNADSVAAFFTPNGTLLEPGIFPIHTRDSIRVFMASFPGVRVDSATASPDTIEVLGNTALLWGSYFERLAFPGQPMSEQYGRFVIQWLQQPDATWLIHRYYRVPLPGPPTAGPQ